VGAFAAGLLIPAGGVASAFLAATALFGVAAVVGLLVQPTMSREPRHLVHRPTFLRAMREAGRLVVDIPAVRTLVLAAVACEILGFSFQTAVPAFSRDVLAAGAEGLGSLSAATSLGGAVAVVGLSLIPSRVRREPMLGIIFVVYGASLLALAPTRELVLAAGVLLVTGACAASFDVLQQTLMQLSVPEEQRGRAIGMWVLGLGSAPIGNLEMGALVAWLGAPAGLAINGGLVLLAAAALLIGAPSYRRVHG
jgi:MFS family permease